MDEHLCLLKRYFGQIKQFFVCYGLLTVAYFNAPAAEQKIYMTLYEGL